MRRGLRQDAVDDAGQLVRSLGEEVVLSVEDDAVRAERLDVVQNGLDLAVVAGAQALVDCIQRHRERNLGRVHLRW